MLTARRNGRSEKNTCTLGIYGVRSPRASVSIAQNPCGNVLRSPPGVKGWPWECTRAGWATVSPSSAPHPAHGWDGAPMLGCPGSAAHMGYPSSGCSARSSAAGTEFPKWWFAKGRNKTIQKNNKRKFLKGKGTAPCVVVAGGRGWRVWSLFLQLHRLSRGKDTLGLFNSCKI